MFEIKALPLQYSLTTGHIITMDEKETIETDAGTIRVVPAWEWLLC